MAEGCVALAEGRASDAVSLLQQGFDHSTPARALRRVEALADAWLAHGALNGAVRVLDEARVVESELRGLLRYADSDQPMLLDLQRLEGVDGCEADAN